jgi:hypothetical protein
MRRTVHAFHRNQARVPLILGVPDRLIVIERLLAGFRSGGWLELWSGVAAPVERQLLPTLFVPPLGVLDLRFDPRHAVSAGRGETVTFTTTTLMEHPHHGIALWYRLVT